MAFHTPTKRSGFSMIEMLIVVVLFAILGYLVTQSTLQSFRGSRKADATGKVRDNLEFAASVVERHVRNAKSITNCTGSGLSQIDYIDQLGRAARFACRGGSNDRYLASESGSLTQAITSDEIVLTACSFSCQTTSPINPPVVDFSFSGVSAGDAAADLSLTTITRRIVLRVY